MVLTGHSGVYSISQLSETECNVILAILRTADRRCFGERDSDGTWYSGDDFVLSLSDGERTALSKLGYEIEMMCNA
jgi:hypothetical protein